VKKAMDLKDSEALVQYKEQFMKDKKAGKAEKGDEWDTPDCPFRVAMRLAGRQMKPVYYYTASLHDAKILQINVELFGKKFMVDRLPSMIELSYQIEKVTRFQKVISILCWAMEKRIVRMSDFQALATNFVDVAAQAEKLRK
jgi:hypothetical protein